MLMDEDRWMYDNIMSEEVEMNDENKHQATVNEEQHVDCSDVFNTSQLARSVAYENGFVAVIMRKKDFVRRNSGSKKCGCPFKLHEKPVVGGQGWMVKLMGGSHNHELAKLLVGHPYVGRLTKDEKTIIANMTKSMVKPRNILLTLKEHNANSFTTIKQIYNARSAYHSSIRGSDTEMQHLMKLLEQDQYIHWHILKDEDVVGDIFWCHPDVVKLCNACNLNHSRCGCVMRTTHGLPCACELSKYVLGPSHLIQSSKLQEIAYPDQNSMCPPPEKVNTKGAQKKPMTKNQKSTKRDPSYCEYVDALHSVQNSNSLFKLSASFSDQAIQRRTMPMLDQFHPFIHDFIENIVDVKGDGNCGYCTIFELLGMGEDSWSLARNHLLKELAKWSNEYISLFGGIDIFEKIKRSLLVTMDKWMDIVDMGYVIASRYNVILVSLSLQQSMTFFPLRSQPSIDSFVHHIICIGHVHGNHFVQCHPQAKQWPTPYISRMHQYKNLVMLKRDYVDLSCSTLESPCTGGSSTDVGATEISGISGSTYVPSCMTSGCLSGSPDCVGLMNGYEIR
ncbi:hypothetical protein HKD37_13G035497 [Glycine soja]